MSKTETLAVAVLVLLSSSCRQEMHDQPRYEPLEASTFFGDGRSARPQVAGTIARGQLRLDEHLYEGRIEGELATSLPIPLTPELLDRGQERFNIFCRPCHGGLGYGDGTIVDRGLTPPPSYHDDRLREAPVGHFFDVMTNGFGRMTSYASRIPADDRWAIAAYVRALQLSQNASTDDVPAEHLSQLEAQ